MTRKKVFLKEIKFGPVVYGKSLKTWVFSGSLGAWDPQGLLQDIREEEGGEKWKKKKKKKVEEEGEEKKEEKKRKKKK